MLTDFTGILNLDDDKKRNLGLFDTAGEISQQPSTWLKTAGLLRERAAEIAGFMQAAGMSGEKKSVIILTGAGTSEFVGNSVQHGLRRLLGREVISIPTTHLVTHAAAMLVPGHDYTVVSFARSGNSPESLATYSQIGRISPTARQLVITCNAEGALAHEAQADPMGMVINLPPETNDRSLVMTSSFSTMAFAILGLTLLKEPEELEKLALRLGEGAGRVMQEYGQVLASVGADAFTRACYLGSGALYGTMQECQLKMQEMTEGFVACRFESYLGLRHGPQVFVNADCIVVAALSGDAAVRRYEMDMLRELREKKQGRGVLAICTKADSELKDLADHIIELYPDSDENAVHDDFRIMTDVVAGQLLGLFKCLACGLQPDNPSSSGTINRVVKGVTIYEE